MGKTAPGLAEEARQELRHAAGLPGHDNGAAPVTALRTCALAALASHVLDLIAGEPQVAEHHFLLAQLQAAGGPGGWRKGVRLALQQPIEYGDPADTLLLALAWHLGLSAGEALCVALAAAVEEEPMVGRVIAYLQQPMGGARPTLGLLATALAAELPDALPPLFALAAGEAVSSGLLMLHGEQAPLPERSIALAQPLALALHGADGAWPGALLGPAAPVPLPPSLHAEARRRAHALGAGELRLLVVRSGAPAEGQAVAAAVAAALELQPLHLQLSAVVAGLGPYLYLRGRVPVFCAEPAPGEHKPLPAIPAYQGPVLVVCGPDGAVELEGETALSWTPPVPGREERALLWQQALSKGGGEGAGQDGGQDLAQELAKTHRHSSGRIAQLGRIAGYNARLHGRVNVEPEDVYAAAWSGDGASLETLAQPLSERIPDAALVAGPALQRDLQGLLLRCRARDGLVDGLGASAQARYRPGVRALFVGASGAGKTLAAGWLATQLQMPLYRVDLAAVTSKYIGETEKNLAQLLARAEQSEVILLFDEADSLFGKRTDIQQANDRFANAQTNYLLQRIETYDGICVLTSNTRSRFDQAFTRRLDVIIEFPTPSPQERRALWLAHLGNGHVLTGQDINRLAAVTDLAGGHVRNVVLSAAVIAHSAGRTINYQDILMGMGDEYRKLGRQLPVEL
ncbi:MAG: ATP-binding protein [Caldilineaceae bacterium]